jgi:glycerol-3-phosphate acyltransferase PlsX
MGGDRGPAAVVGGLADAAEKNPDVRFLLHGDEAALRPLLARRPDLSGRVELRHAARVVSMSDKPSQVMRHGEGTSMWATIEAVKRGEAAAAVSCGNTGALMAVSMIRLRKLPGVNRPAIICLWPSRNPGGFNVMLDVGADVRADAEDLLQFAAMGASYARNGMGLAKPRVGLLNVGTEENKGRPEMKAAHDRMAAAAVAGGYEFVGFVEGGDIPGDRVDVIVTDGFTGNVALKVTEGVMETISSMLNHEIMSSIFHKIGFFFLRRSLKRIQKRMDYAEYGGALLLGVNGLVVIGHGRSNPRAIKNAIALSKRFIREHVLERIGSEMAQLPKSLSELNYV